MGFYDDRKKRIEIFEDTINQCNDNSVLTGAVDESIEKQILYFEGDEISENAKRAETPCKVVVSRKRSFEAAMPYAQTGKKVCVLNFASAMNPGGGVLNGSGAQEECLCRCSTLYIPIASVRGTFHDYHRELATAKKMNGFYNDDCIYTPGIVVFKTDTVLPQAMPESDWYKVDVITCAAPNLRQTKCGDDELFELHKKRLRRILQIAALNGDEIVILGAFGCGAFCNPPEVVAKAEKEIVDEFKDRFETIEFAVFCPPHDDTNYVVFKNVLE